MSTSIHSNTMQMRHQVSLGDPFAEIKDILHAVKMQPPQLICFRLANKAESILIQLQRIELRAEEREQACNVLIVISRKIAALSEESTESDIRMINGLLNRLRQFINLV